MSHFAAAAGIPPEEALARALDDPGEDLRALEAVVLACDEASIVHSFALRVPGARVLPLARRLVTLEHRSYLLAIALRELAEKHPQILTPEVLANLLPGDHPLEADGPLLGPPLRLLIPRSHVF